MAGISDPFTPGPTTDPTAGVDPSTYDNLRSQWSSFMDNPQGRAALLSAGIALMQPPSFGDTGAGQIGRAIGAAGQSATANQAMDIRQSEAESKQGLREAQSTLAGARAETAGAKASSAADLLQYRRDKMAQDAQLRKMGLTIQAHNSYNRFKEPIEKANREGPLLTPGYVPKPVPTFDEFLASTPAFRELVGGAASGGGAEPPPAAVSDLKANPALRGAFDAKYGAGAAARALGE